MEIVFLVLFSIVTVTVSFSKYLNRKHQKKLNDLANSRPNITGYEYIKTLTETGFNKDHSTLVYNLIKENFAPENFSIYPEDDLFKIYDIDDEFGDIELIDTICEKLNLRKVTQDDIDLIEKTHKSFNAIFLLKLINHLKSDK